MRRQRKRLPDARDGRLTHVAIMRQAARRPMGRVARRRFERRRQYALDVGVGNLSRDTGTRLVELFVRRWRDKSAAPFADRVLDYMQIASDRRGGLAGPHSGELIVPTTRELGQASDGASSVRAGLVRQSPAQSAVAVCPVASACRPCSRERTVDRNLFHGSLTQGASGRVLCVSSRAQTGVLEGDRRPRC